MVIFHLSFGEVSLTAVLILFVIAAGVITVSGVKLASIANKLADRTGLGEIIAGALFVGASTSLPGAITSITTAAEQAGGLAIGNALGGLTAQTAFLAIADLVYRRANLEHAAATATGLAQGVLLITLLMIPLIAASESDITILGVHPASILSVAVYAFGLKLLGSIKDEPMWRAIQTKETREEISDSDRDADSRTDAALWTRFVSLASITAVAGYVIGQASVEIVQRTGLSESAVGTAFSAVANSLPELVTAIAAVRIGAVSLAVGDIIGGNAFEVLFLSAADLFYD
ncbi:MAG: sodium:calcium antiporter, partial [Alphaproteobacteria bacterium]|nr:sodium:calcium antiporter [Alphaproteobacteria bacterium]